MNAKSQENESGRGKQTKPSCLEEVFSQGDEALAAFEKAVSEIQSPITAGFKDRAFKAIDELKSYWQAKKLTELGIERD